MSKKTHISVCLPNELLEKLRIVAAQESRSMSSLVRILIRQYMKELDKKDGITAR